MGKEDTHNLDADGMRRQAEAIVRAEKNRFREDLEAMSGEDIRQMLHELRVHQVQLEMQNQELQRQQQEMAQLRARYFDLYDLAPVGYCTLSEEGIIQEANLAAATLLGVDRRMLVKQPISGFILKEDQDIFYMFCKRLFHSGQRQVCELRIRRGYSQQFWAWLEGTAAQDEEGASVFRVVVSDVTQRKQAEEALAHFHSLMRYIIEHANSAVAVHDRD